MDTAQTEFECVVATGELKLGPRRGAELDASVVVVPADRDPRIGEIQDAKLSVSRRVLNAHARQERLLCRICRGDPISSTPIEVAPLFVPELWEQSLDIDELDANTNDPAALLCDPSKSSTEE